MDFNYVRLKVSDAEVLKSEFLTDTNDIDNNYNKKKIVQIIDVSHKLLYDDIKAERDFHSMISATVSHELRNPLNSMICQLSFLNYNLSHLQSFK